MARKRIINLTLEEDTISILNQMVKESQRHGKKISRSGIIDTVIQERCSDKLQRKIKEAKKLAIQMHALNQEIDDLKEAKYG